MNFVFTTVLVAIVSCTLADAYVLPHSKESILSSIEQKCKNNSHNNHAYRDLADGFEYLPQCAGKVLGNPAPTFIDGYHLFCNRFGSLDYYTCIENFIKILSPCLDEEEEYLPDFILTSYNVSLESKCYGNGKSRVNEIIKDINSSTCGINQQSLNTMHIRCCNDLIVTRNIENDVFILKKDDLCSDIRSWKECMIQKLKVLCNEDHTETISFIIDPFLVTC